MKINIETGRIEKLKTDGAVLLLFDGEEMGKAAARLDESLGGMIGRVMKRGDFKARPGAVHLMYPGGAAAPERVLLAGLGKRGEFTPNRLRQAMGKAAPALRAAGATDAAVLIDGLGMDPEETGQAIAEGALLGLYRFLRYKTDEENERKKDIRTITLVSDSEYALSQIRDILESKAFRRGLSRYVEKALGGVAPPRPTLAIDGQVTLSDLTLDLVADRFGGPHFGTIVGMGLMGGGAGCLALSYWDAWFISCHALR